MPGTSPRVNLYVRFEGPRGSRKPVAAAPRAPRTGIKVRVSVEPVALERKTVYLLYRRGDGDMLLAASAHREVAEGVLGRIDPTGRDYLIEAVPVLDSGAKNPVPVTAAA